MGTRFYLAGSHANFDAVLAGVPEATVGRLAAIKANHPPLSEELYDAITADPEVDSLYQMKLSGYGKLSFAAAGIIRSEDLNPVADCTQDQALIDRLLRAQDVVLPESVRAMVTEAGWS